MRRAARRALEERAVLARQPSDLADAPRAILSSLSVFDMSLGGLVCARVGSPSGSSSCAAASLAAAWASVAARCCKSFVVGLRY